MVPARRSRSGVVAPDHVGHARGLGRSLGLVLEVEGGLDAALDLVDLRQRDVHPQPGAHLDRGRKANPVKAVVEDDLGVVAQVDAALEVGVTEECVSRDDCIGEGDSIEAGRANAAECGGEAVADANQSSAINVPQHEARRNIFVPFSQYRRPYMFDMTMALPMTKMTMAVMT